MKLLRSAALRMLVMYALIGSSHAAPGEPVRIIDAWIQEGPPSVAVLAGYLVLENPGTSTVRVIAIRSPDAERIEIHRTDITEDTATMTRIDELPVPPRGKVVFSPGGYHLMIFGVDRIPRAGDRMPLELTLGSGQTIRIEAGVRRDATDGNADIHTGEHDHD